MSLQPSRAALISSPSRSLCALLALLLLTPPGSLASGESEVPAGRTRAERPAGPRLGGGLRVPRAGKCPRPSLLEKSSSSNLPYNGVSLSATAGPEAIVQRELRCVCVTLASSVYPKMISTLQVIPEGPHCPSVQVM